MGNSMRPLDLAILVAYLVGVTAFGCSFYFRKSAKGTAGFVAGGGHVPSWAISLSIFATYVSSISFLALPAKAFASNWNALVLSFTVPADEEGTTFTFRLKQNGEHLKSFRISVTKKFYVDPNGTMPA